MWGGVTTSGMTVYWSTGVCTQNVYVYRNQQVRAVCLVVTQWIVLVWVETLRSVTDRPGGSWTMAVYSTFSGDNAFQD